MSWDRLEASAWLAPTPAAKASDAGRTSQASPAGGGKAVLMQGGTGDSEVSHQMAKLIELFTYIYIFSSFFL